MSWLIDLALAALPNVWPYLAAVAITVGAYVAGRSKGASNVKQKLSDAALKQVVKGQEAARKGRADAVEKLAEGKTPQEIRRENDAKW